MSTQQNGNPVLPAVCRHDVYYIPGGDLYFLVENVHFRVHRYFFERESSFFRRELQPKADGISNGSTESTALLIEESAADFAKFLWVFYNAHHSVYDAPIDDWKLILRLAHQWKFPEVFALCVRELKKNNLSDVEWIATFNDFGINNRHIIPCYAALCARAESLTLAEGSRLGLSTVLTIARVRDYARSSLVTDGVRLPSPAKIGDVEMRALVKVHIDISTPSDLLDLIFRFSLVIEGEGSRVYEEKYDFRLAIKLASVCTRWRQIFLSSPIFWTNVVILTTAPAPELTRMVLQRSRNLPIIVEITTPPAPDRYSDPLPPWDERKVVQRIIRTMKRDFLRCRELFFYLHSSYAIPRVTINLAGLMKNLSCLVTRAVHNHEIPAVFRPHDIELVDYNALRRHGYLELIVEVSIDEYNFWDLQMVNQDRWFSSCSREPRTLFVFSIDCPYDIIPAHRSPSLSLSDILPFLGKFTDIELRIIDIIKPNHGSLSETYTIDELSLRGRDVPSNSLTCQRLLHFLPPTSTLAIQTSCLAGINLPYNDVDLVLEATTLRGELEPDIFRILREWRGMRLTLKCFGASSKDLFQKLLEITHSHDHDGRQISTFKYAPALDELDLEGLRDLDFGLLKDLCEMRSNRDSSRGPVGILYLSFRGCHFRPNHSQEDIQEWVQAYEALLTKLEE
ncbi:hypothetical protein H0H93_013001 [Arthromyces matolae]|nr:hypothetical protein H0H93_013001 [Arthromyces matolae]